MPIRFLDKNVVARTPDTCPKVCSCQYARALQAVVLRCVVFGKLTIYRRIHQWNAIGCYNSQIFGGVRMKVEWMNHTGLSVSDMDRSLEFYRDMLGLEIERDSILEGDFLEKLNGIPGAKVHIVYLGNGDGRHSVELVEFLNPIAPPREHNMLDASHMGFFVDDLDQFYTELSAKGIIFVNPPILLPDAIYPSARKICFAQDPDGNLLEFMERAPGP